MACCFEASNEAGFYAHCGAADSSQSAEPVPAGSAGVYCSDSPCSEYVEPVDFLLLA